MSEKAPSIYQEQLKQDVEAAKDAALPVYGHHAYVGRGDRSVVLGETRSYSPSMTVDKGVPGVDAGYRITASATKKGPNTYQAYDTKIARESAENDYSELTVARIDNRTGQKYEHTFKDPNAARRFGSVIAKQVARRAEAAESANERRAA